jgi:endonuclease YncB( thermonuclease family)
LTWIVAARPQAHFSRRRRGKSCRWSVPAAVFALAGAAAFAAVSLWSGSALAAAIQSYAFVQDDGSLKISGRTVHLFGIYIPPTDYTCRTFLSPVKCAPRAVLMLDLKIGLQFVRCEEVSRNADGSLSAYCSVNGEDLGAWMLSQGWALATPQAPFEYGALDSIARTKGIGVWGFPVDRIR